MGCICDVLDGGLGFLVCVQMSQPISPCLMLTVFVLAGRTWTEGDACSAGVVPPGEG